MLFENPKEGRQCQKKSKPLTGIFGISAAWWFMSLANKQIIFMRTGYEHPCSQPLWKFKKYYTEVK
ncbi:DUF4222 domain-containing protein [Prodigiosinella aquatilis]|uniref:DUF4222 domain-containing protein n=1 Tax=Brenneria uluponensis TaxID=3057057 RepID=UPI0028E711DF|nr:DUF4222 domain-containing protein [Brenneria ulupoensis]